MSARDNFFKSSEDSIRRARLIVEGQGVYRQASGTKENTSTVTDKGLRDIVLTDAEQEVLEHAGLA